MRQNSPLTAGLLRFGTWANGFDLYKVLSISILKGVPITTLQGPEVAGKAWKQIADRVGQYDEPGKSTTCPAQRPGTFEVTVYHDGKRYLAARGEEYGFANYEVVPEKR